MYELLTVCPLNNHLMDGVVDRPGSKFEQYHLPITDHIFCIRQILEKKWEYNEAVHQLFIDFKKA